MITILKAIFVGILIGLCLIILAVVAINILFSVWYEALGKLYQIKRSYQWKQKIRRAEK